MKHMKAERIQMQDKRASQIEGTYKTKRTDLEIEGASAEDIISITAHTMQEGLTITLRDYTSQPSRECL